MTEQEYGLPELADDGHDIAALIVQAVAVSRVGFAPTAAGDCVDGELLLEERPHELPVGVVVAEATVHEDQGWAAPVSLVGNAGPSR